MGAWRFLPQEWPPWQTAYSYLRRWRRDGTWERIHWLLREALRLRLGRNRQPSAGSIDRSMKTSDMGGPRGFDSDKKVEGRKRHLLVDTEGLVLRAVVHPADIMDRDGVKLVLYGPVRTDFPRLHHVWLDSSYHGKGKGKDWIEQTLGWSAEIMAHRRWASKEWILADQPADQADHIDWSTFLPPLGFASFRDDGWWSAPSPGKASNADSARMTSASAPPARPGST
jgi:putative transposase